MEGKYLYSKPYAQDANSVKYNTETGELVEICGFWIGLATQKTPPCATPDELEKARKRNM